MEVLALLIAFIVISLFVLALPAFASQGDQPVPGGDDDIPPFLTEEGGFHGCHGGTWWEQGYNTFAPCIDQPTSPPQSNRDIRYTKTAYGDLNDIRVPTIQKTNNIAHIKKSQAVNRATAGYFTPNSLANTGPYKARVLKTYRAQRPPAGTLTDIIRETTKRDLRVPMIVARIPELQACWGDPGDWDPEAISDAMRTGDTIASAQYGKYMIQGCLAMAQTNGIFYPHELREDYPIPSINSIVEVSFVNTPEFSGGTYRILLETAVQGGGSPLVDKDNKGSITSNNPTQTPGSCNPGGGVLDLAGQLCTNPDFLACPTPEEEFYSQPFGVPNEVFSRWGWRPREGASMSDVPNSSGWRPHSGIDIYPTGHSRANFGAIGTPVLSIGAGRVAKIDMPPTLGEPWNAHRLLLPSGDATTVSRGANNKYPDIPIAFLLTSAPSYDGEAATSYGFNNDGIIYPFTATSGNGAGIYIEIELTDGCLVGQTVRYAHLGAIHPDMVVNGFVAEGQEIGVMGSTAIMNDDPHLHLAFGRWTKIADSSPVFRSPTYYDEGAVTLDPSCYITGYQDEEYLCDQNEGMVKGTFADISRKASKTQWGQENV